MTEIIATCISIGIDLIAIFLMLIWWELRNIRQRQIPKEPIDKIMYKECPICGSVDLGKYCMECGQALKWE